jgi:DNA-binding beta-propeller fold protein YncE/predicted GH43/DUF377 family glycosyl hydrolase
VRLLLLVSILSACVKNQGLPFVGDCAAYPDGIYEYGQIGIGDCLSGPTGLAFVDPDDPVLIVTNSNPYATFDGGSLLALRWSEIDLDVGKNLVDELSPRHVDLPSYAGALALAGDLALVGSRFSDDARTRTDDDDLWLVDLSTPAEPTFGTRGDDGGPTVRVGPDPVDIAYDESTGFAYVANRTAHSVSVLDTTTDPIEVIPPWPEQTISEAVFTDADASGSRAALADLTVFDSTLVPDEQWTLSWVDGSWTLWVPNGDALRRTTNTGGPDYVPSAIGDELHPDDWEGIGAFDDPSYYLSSPGRMFFADEGALFLATTIDYLGNWEVDADPILAPPEGESYGGPSLLFDGADYYLFHDTVVTAEDGTVSTRIDLAVADDESFVFAPAVLVWEPPDELAHESAGASDPFVFFDPEEARYRMFYTAYDGERYAIGEATSEDLVTWARVATPVLAVDGVDVAAPAVADVFGKYRMWYSRREGDTWSVGLATSTDGGTGWTDTGAVLAIDSPPEGIPRVALSSEPAELFRLQGENLGVIPAQIYPGLPFDLTGYGWSAAALAGFQLDAGDQGSDSDGGIAIDSIDRAAGLAWLTFTNGAGTRSIGVASIDTKPSAAGAPGDSIVVASKPVIVPGDSGFDQSGVHHAVVWRDIAGTIGPKGRFHCFYAGDDGAITTIGLATSDDGRAFTKVGQVLDVGDDWDSATLEPGSIEVLEDGTLRLWYTGGDGTELRIGAAEWDVDEFVRPDDAWILAAGAPGEWDDSGVRDPYFVADADGEHLYYAGFDGDEWQVGYAVRDDDEWVRAHDTATDELRPVIAEIGGLFGADGLVRPVAERTTDGWSVWYAGLDAGVLRVGLTRGRGPEWLHKVENLPTLGDTLAFDTEKGSEDTYAIPLDGFVDEADLTGIGLTSVTFDGERGFLYAASKETPYLFTVDVRDDSGPGTTDLDYLDVEAVLGITTASGGAGFREVLPIPGTDRALALNDSPTTIMVVDLGDVVDDDYSELLYDDVIGYLPAPRGKARDAGVTNQSSIGPAQLLVHPDGVRLFVTNFNANSISVYDLSLGPYGTPIAEVGEVGEAPYGMALTPDGNFLVFANTLGEVDGDLAHSTLGVLDVDPTSDTYLQVRTWIANR